MMKYYERIKTGLHWQLVFIDQDLHLSLIFLAVPSCIHQENLVFFKSVPEMSVHLYSFK